MKLFRRAPTRDMALIGTAPKTLTHVPCAACKGLREEFSDAPSRTWCSYRATPARLRSALAAFYEPIPVGHVEAGVCATDTRARILPRRGQPPPDLTVGARSHFRPTRVFEGQPQASGVSVLRSLVTGNNGDRTYRHCCAWPNNDPPSAWSFSGPQLSSEQRVDPGHRAPLADQLGPRGSGGLENRSGGGFLEPCWSDLSPDTSCTAARCIAIPTVRETPPRPPAGPATTHAPSRCTEALDYEPAGELRSEIPRTPNHVHSLCL